MEVKTGTARDVEFSKGELEAAVGILSAEEDRRIERRKFILRLVMWAVLGIPTFACPLGLLIVWFDRVLGWAFLIPAILGYVVFAILYATKEGRRLMGAAAQRAGARSSGARGGPLSQALGEALPLRFYVPSMLLVGLAFLSYMGGCGWLVYGLVTTEALNPSSVVLMAVAILILSLGMGAFYAVTERYYDQVAKMRTDLESRLESTSPEEPTGVSARVYQRVAQIEQRQVRRQVKQVVDKLSELQGRFYGLVVSPEAQDELQKLPAAKQVAIREALFSLQSDPHPEDEQPLPDVPNGFVIRREGQTISYLVNDELKRATVIALAGGRGDGEVDHGS